MSEIRVFASDYGVSVTDECGTPIVAESGEEIRVRVSVAASIYGIGLATLANIPCGT